MVFLIIIVINSFKKKRVILEILLTSVAFTLNT